MTNANSKDSGHLYVVGTPIGHLDDLTNRAVDVLKSCDLILCEDTRHSKRLLQTYNIDTPLRSLHAHNEHQVSTTLVEQIKSGQNMALISDAGTPLISDPGVPLVAEAHKQNIPVSPIPGASAIISLLSVAGLPVQPFTFHGFIPPKKNQRMAFYKHICPLDHTHVFYESSHRIAQSITDLASVLSSRDEVCVGRELTKRFEQLYRGSAEQVMAMILNGPNHQKGEFVVAVSGQAVSNTNELDEKTQQLALSLKPLLPPKQAAAIVANHYQVNKKQIYEFIISQSDD